MLSQLKCTGAHVKKTLKITQLTLFCSDVFFTIGWGSSKKGKQKVDNDSRGQAMARLTNKEVKTNKLNVHTCT